MDKNEIKRILSLPLPEVIELNTCKAMAETKFSFAFSQWKLLPSHKLAVTLQSLKSGKSNAEQLLFLKEYRKKSDIIRRLYQTSSKRQIAPKTFDKFVTRLGHLNDAIENNQTEIVSQKSSEILSMNLQSVFKEVKFFNAAPSRVTKKTTEKLFVEIGDKSNPDIVTAKKFHDLRKEMKLILGHFTILHELYRQVVDYKQTLDYLNGLNDAMGVANDSAMAISLSGKEKYKSLRVEISQELSLAIEKALVRFKLAK